jgi:hypothetical protein
MSFNFWVYRAPEGLEPVTKWPQMLSEGLGSPAKVSAVIKELLPSVKWLSHEGHHTFGEAVDPVYNGGFFLTLYENDTGSICLIATSNHASPSTLRAIMDRFSLNYCCTDFGDFRKPHSVDNNWKELPK